MKKTLTIVLVTMLLIAGLFVLTACEKKDNIPAEDATQGEVAETSGGSVVGQWKLSMYGYDYIYTFNEDGTGNYNAAGTDMPFTYKTEGDQISILYDGNTVPFDTTYSVNGTTLNVVDSLGEDTLYEKVK